MFRFTLGSYSLMCHPDCLTNMYDSFVKHADFVEEFDLRNPEGTVCFVGVQSGLNWPFLVVAQRYNAEGGFSPGALLVPETGLLFIGAGERLLAYKLDSRERLWIDRTEFGFLAWARHGDRVILSGELELACWDIDGKKCWSCFVEPPWTYSVVEKTVYLDVMGKKTSFPLDLGPTRSEA